MIVFDGAKLKKMRLDAKMTQYDLAPLTKISQTRISDIERNVTKPSLSEITAFMSVFNKNGEEFGSEEKDIVVVEKAYSKKKKDDEEKEELKEQLELFPSVRMLTGVDLAGYVLIDVDHYAELKEDQKKLQKLQELLNKGVI